jgi:lipopolysaccharide/colanic/teichoic acid biosynthesis glycosyltransferase
MTYPTLSTTASSVTEYALRQTDSPALGMPIADVELPNYLERYAPANTWQTCSIQDIQQPIGLFANKHIFLTSGLSKVQDPNSVFEQVRKWLEPEQYFSFRIVTAENIKFTIQDSYNQLVFWLYYPFHFLIRRVLPKLKGFRKLCRLLQIPVDISKAEIMGRLVYKGFDLIDVVEHKHETLLITKPNPANNPSLSRPLPSEGFLFRMQRMGQHGKPIHVYKFRSMHPYSEYIQAYVHEQHGMDEGGKFKNDFRITTGGRAIRKFWLDEIPMLYNLLRGDIKLVGVRPISAHYFSLYPALAQEIRRKHKPGLLPPFYADLPQSFDEIVQSELAYLRAYEANPIQTDLRYLKRILANIIIRKARSQ